MLDSIIADTLPDAGCLEAGDQYAVLAARCFAAAGLANAAIAERLCGFFPAPEKPEPPPRHDDAAWALAKHCAAAGVAARQTIVWIGRLSMVPGWPDDPEHIAAIARAAFAEVAS